MALPPPRPTDRYASIETGEEVETKVRGSSFLARAFRVARAEHVATELAAVRKRYHDATHHGSAFRLGEPGSITERSDDDGEPSGTAGVPILGAIQRSELHGVLVVVTRYFGGTKLGTGGLVRAYGDAARIAIEAAPPRTVHLEEGLEVRVGYDDVGSVEAILAREGAHLRGVEREFGGDAAFRVRVLRSQAPALREIVTEATAGRARLRSLPPDATPATPIRKDRA